MIKLGKYLKPFLPFVALTLALLFGQAMCELNLPNYMSRIVNVGLQQSGIERASPEAVSQEDFLLATGLMTETDKALTENSYTLKTDESYRKSYPGMGASGIFILNKTDKPTRERLDMAFGRAAMKLAAFASPEAAAFAGGALADNEMYINQAGVMFTRGIYSNLGMDAGSIQTRYILMTGLQMLLIAFLGGAATIIVGLLTPRIAAGAARNLRRDIFNKVESFSQHEFDKFSSASLITRCTNDVGQMQMLVGMGLRMLCYAPIMGVGGVIMALRKSASMSWIIALAVLVLIGLVLVVVSVALPRFKIIQKLVDKLNLISRENLNGLMVIRAFGTQKHEQSRFDAANQDLTKTNLFVQRVMAFVFPAITLIMNGVTLLIVWFGAKQISESTLQIGDMMAFMQYAMQIIMSFMTISMMFIFVPRAAVSGERIAEVLDTPLSVTDPDNPKPFDASQKGVVEFKNVHFKYFSAEAEAITDISFTARPGQTTAIIGATGAGKSTIANLLLRFYDVSQGQITVGGVDVRGVTQAALREKIGYVPQKAVLLSGTVRSNISYGQESPLSDEELALAADIAQALDFITEKDGGFEADISQGGANVSGGQKQRLSIARALAKKPEILMLDDSFSALDFKTDAKLRKALKEHTAEATVIIIAQRVGTIMHAEQIIVLDEGRIVGAGRHDELLKTCPAYFEIASSQLEIADGEGGASA